MVLFGNVFLANIYDDYGELIETKKIKFTFTRPKIKTFTWNNGEYIVPNTSFMFKLSPFPYFFSYWICSYQKNVPIAIKQMHTMKPLLYSDDFMKLLRNSVLEKLMGVRNNWFNFLTTKNILIGLAILGFVFFLLSGGSFDSVASSLQPGGK